MQSRWFGSDRERRLWGWTAVVVAGIYATLGLAGTIVGLAPEWLPVLVFWGGFVGTGLTVLTQGLRVRPGGAEVAVVLGVAAVFLMVGVRVGVTVAERTHLLEYSVVAVFVYEALLERVRSGRAVPAPAVLAVLGTWAVGLLDEGLQAVLPGRVFDPVDILFNVLAALLAVGASLVLGAVRRRLD